AFVTSLPGRSLGERWSKRFPTEPGRRRKAGARTIWARARQRVCRSARRREAGPKVDEILSGRSWYSQAWLKVSALLRSPGRGRRSRYNFAPGLPTRARHRIYLSRPALDRWRVALLAVPNLFDQDGRPLARARPRFARARA